jgi:hypothetical protein
MFEHERVLDHWVISVELGLRELDRVKGARAFSVGTLPSMTIDYID